MLLTAYRVAAVTDRTAAMCIETQICFLSIGTMDNELDAWRSSPSFPRSFGRSIRLFKLGL